MSATADPVSYLVTVDSPVLLVASGNMNYLMIILPYHTKVVRKIIQGRRRGIPLTFLAARELGIMFLKEEVTNNDIVLRYGSNIHPNPFFAKLSLNFN